MCPHKFLHEGTLFGLVGDDVAETEVAELGDGVLVLLLVGICCPLLDENIVDFHICVYDASLVQIPDALKYVLSPNCELCVLDGLVFPDDLST